MKINKSFIVLIILFAVAAIYFFSNSKGSLNLRNSSFEIKTPEEITKVQISTSDNSLILVKEFQQWKLNEKYIAREKSIMSFLLALNRIDISSPVSNLEKKQISSILKADGLKLEVFKRNRLIKEYYVSKSSMNKDKTYMMMCNSEEPFVVRIPSFNGLVADLFITDENYWRDKTIFNYQPQNINKITVEYPENPSKSFQVINYNDGTFAIKELKSNSFLKEFNVENVARYFTYYQRIVFEDVVRDIDQVQVDSVINSSPFRIITVEDIQGVSNKIETFRKPTVKGNDEFGQKIKFDYDRAYASFNNNKELVVVQYYIFDPLFKEIDYFR